MHGLLTFSVRAANRDELARLRHIGHQALAQHCRVSASGAVMEPLTPAASSPARVPLHSSRRKVGLLILGLASVLDDVATSILPD